MPNQEGKAASLYTGTFRHRRRPTTLRAIRYRAVPRRWAFWSWFADLETALRSDRHDGVVIATPNQLHVAGGLAPVRAGVPVLLEKPVSGDVESALQLVTESEKAGVPILV